MKRTIAAALVPDQVQAKEVDTTINPGIVNFGSFSAENVERETKLVSKNLKLRDITPFKSNVRKEYKEESIEGLKQSILTHGDIENISVYHIIDTDTYIISDGHMRRLAYLELFGEDHELEVFVKKEFPTFSIDVKKELMAIGFVTSNTKLKLSVYDKLYAAIEFLETLDEIEPEKAPHKVSQQSVYLYLGFSKSDAMQLNNLLETFTPDQFENFKNEELSLNILKKLAAVDDKEKLDLILKIIEKKGVIKSSTDVTDVLDAIDYVEKENRGSIQNMSLDEKMDMVVKESGKSHQSKDVQEGNKKILEVKKPVTNEMKYIHEIHLGAKKIKKAFVNINAGKLTNEQKSELESIKKSLVELFKMK